MFSLELANYSPYNDEADTADVSEDNISLTNLETETTTSLQDELKLTLISLKTSEKSQARSGNINI